MPDLHFRFMAFCFCIRDLVRKPADVLNRIPLMPGQVVLDYGCGTGSYAVAAAEIVAPSGKVYAADVNPLAVRSAERKAARKGVSNLRTIKTTCETDLDDSCADIVLLYDTLHALGDSRSVLKELHRVLRPGGTLSCSDHHRTEQAMIEELTGDGLFMYSGRSGHMVSFTKAD